MKDYEKTKEELEKISETLKLFPESLQEKVYDTLISQYLGKETKLLDETKQNSSKKAANVGDKDIKKPTKEKAKNTKGKASKKESFKIIKDLDLLGSGDLISLKKFISEKKPSSNIEFNTVVIYYLDKLLKVENISINYVYTCYKHYDKKVPAALRQSIFDTSGSRYGYISIKNNNYSIPTSGENLVEHELSRNKGDN